MRNESETPYRLLNTDGAPGSRAGSRRSSTATDRTEVILVNDPPSSPRTPSYKPTPDCVESCCDVIRNPLSFGSLFLFFLGALVGVAAIGFCIVGNDTLYLPAAIGLILVGVVAFFELKAIGTLETQILRIERSVDTFDGHCKCLECKNHELRDQAEKFQKQITQISPQRNELWENSKSLEAKRGQLITQQREAEKENMAFQANVDKLFEVRHKLSSKAEILTNGVDELRTHISALDGIRKKILEITGDSNENITELLKGMNNNYERMEKLVIQNERILLQDCALRQEFKDHDSGLSKREFTRFTRLMPKKFREIVKKENINFDNVKAHDSDVVTPVNIDALIEKLLALSQGESAIEYDLEEIGFL